MSTGKINGKQIKDTTVDLLKFNLSGSQGGFIYVTGSYLGAYEVPNDGLAYVNKNYVDALSAGIIPKASCKTVANSPISLTTATSSPFISGYTMSSGDRILVWQQADAKQNGIYVYNGSTFSRSTDMDGNPTTEVQVGDYTFVTDGTDAGDGYVIIGGTAGTILNVGVDNIVWTEFMGPANFIWGNGLINTSGHIIDIDLLSTGGLTFSSGQLTIADYIAGNGLTITSGVLAVGAANGISVDADTVGINYTEASVGLEGQGLTASGGKINVDLATLSGLTFSASGGTGQLTISYDNTLSVGPDGRLTVLGAATSIISINGGKGLTATVVGHTASVDVELTTNGGLTFSDITQNSTLQVDYTSIALQLAGAGLNNNGTTIDINVMKGVTFSGDYLFADASTILTTAGLPNVSTATNSTIQSALTAIDNALANVGAQQELAINNNPTGTFLKSVNSPMNVLGYTFSTASDGSPHIYINGVYVKTNAATASSAAFFSTDGGVSSSTSVVANSVLWLNPFVLGFNLDPTDDIVVHYLTMYP